MANEIWKTARLLDTDDRNKYLEGEKRRVWKEQTPKFAKSVDMTLTLLVDAYHDGIASKSSTSKNTRQPLKNAVTIVGDHNTIATMGSVVSFESKHRELVPLAESTSRSNKIPYPIVVLCIAVLVASMFAVCWHVPALWFRVSCGVGALALAWLLPRNPELFFRRQIGICMSCIVAKHIIPHFRVEGAIDVAARAPKVADAAIRANGQLTTVAAGIDVSLIVAVLVLGALEWKRMNASDQCIR